MFAVFSLPPFQSTPSQRGRRSTENLAVRQAFISIHALAKRATTQADSGTDSGTISIHALAKRATISLRFVGFAVAISIHALAKRATLPVEQSVFALDYFNPRPRKEGDGSCRLGGKYRDISIHALAKRATFDET